MSEVKGNSNLSNASDGLLHLSKPNIAANDKPLENTATALHPLPKKSTPSTQQANTPQNKTQEIQFHSGRGSKANEKLDPFAEQNAKRAEKEKIKTKRKKKIAIIGSVVGGVTIISIAIIVVFALIGSTDEENKVSETITDYNTIQNESQQAFDDTDKSASEITEYYENLINRATSDEEKSTLRISEISSLAQNGFINEAINVATEFETTSYWQSSNQAQLGIYYGIMINIYSNLNDVEQINYYMDLLQQTEFKPDTEVIG